MNASLDLRPSGRALTPASPRLMSKYELAAASSTAAATTRLITGRRMTVRAVQYQNPPASADSLVLRRWIKGMRMALTLSPIRPRTAGSRVMDASTAAMTTKIAPGSQTLEDRHRQDQQTCEGQDDGHPADQHRATGGVACRRDGVDLLQSPRSLFPVAGDDKEGVVDADGQPHHGDHIGHEEGQVKGLAYQRCGPEGHDYSGYRQHDREKGRGDDAEHQRQNVID